MRSTNIKGPIGTIHIIEASPPVAAGESESLPVVFVHGMAVSANIWDAQLARVARTRRAIALDMRGHGDSAPPEDGNYAPPPVQRMFWRYWMGWDSIEWRS